MSKDRASTNSFKVEMRSIYPSAQRAESTKRAEEKGAVCPCVEVAQTIFSVHNQARSPPFSWFKIKTVVRQWTEACLNVVLLLHIEVYK